MSEYTHNGTDGAAEKAREIGAKHGTNAGTWIEVGDLKDSELRDLADGTISIFDLFIEMPGPLSGEYAGGYSVDALAFDCGIEVDWSSEDGDYGVLQDLANEYETAYWQAFDAEVMRSVEARQQIGPQH